MIEPTSTFYLIPGISIEERAERITNRPCWCADPEKVTACGFCFAHAHLKAAVDQATKPLDDALRLMKQWHGKRVEYQASLLRIARDPDPRVIDASDRLQREMLDLDKELVAAIEKVQVPA